MTSTLTKATFWVHDNEPCFELSETNRVSKVAGAGVRRMQVVVVIRDDERWVYETDLGPASTFQAEEFVIPGAVPTVPGHFEVLETVGRLRGAADDWRAYYGRTERTHEPVDLVKQAEEFFTKRRDARRGKKQFSLVSGGER